MIVSLGLEGRAFMIRARFDGRRYDIDALRVLCFATLIIYHTSLIYGTRTWLLNAGEGSRLADLISVGSHPWRMSLLFFISGLVTASLLKKRSMAEIRKARTRQLLVPFLFGILVVVPPQIYLSVDNTVAELSYGHFWMIYVMSGLRLEHMWFLAYLWIYLVAWSFAMPRLKAYWPDVSSAFVRLLAGKRLLLVPIAFFSILRVGLYPLFGETLVITTDIYVHVLYFSMFVAGALVVDEPRFWQEIDRQRWVGVGLTAISLLALTIVVMAIPRHEWPAALVVAVRITRSILQWCAIVSLLAFAARLANRPNRVIAYLNRSIMTYYIVHQTVIVIVAYHMAQAGMLEAWSFVPIIIITAVTCAMLAELKRIMDTRLWPAISNLVWRNRAAPEPLSVKGD